MKIAWAIRHIAFEDLGLLDPLLRARGYEIRHHAAGADLPTPVGCDSADLLVVLGGPMDADDYATHPNLRDEVAILRHRRERDLPTLGICLGAQMMALAIGGAVRPMPRKEIGWGTASPHAVADSPLWFPHVYGPIPVQAVVEVHDFPCEQDGSFVLPEAVAVL